MEVSDPSPALPPVELLLELAPLPAPSTRLPVPSLRPLLLQLDRRALLVSLLNSPTLSVSPSVSSVWVLVPSLFSKREPILSRVSS